MPVVVKKIWSGGIKTTVKAGVIRLYPKQGSIKMTARYNEVTVVAPLYDVDYQSILDRATALGYTLPTVAQRAKQNQLVVSLKAAGIWVLLDVFYRFETDGDSNYATLNWKNPLLYQCSKVNSPTFTANLGFTGNGTSSYLNTSFRPGLDALVATANSASIGCEVRGGSQANRDSYEFAALNAGTTTYAHIISNYSTTAPAGKSINRIGISAGSAEQFDNNGLSNGRYIATKYASGNLKVYKDGINKIAITGIANRGLPTVSLTFLAGNTDGSITNFSNRCVGGGLFAGSLNGLEATYDSILNTYFTSL